MDLRKFGSFGPKLKGITFVLIHEVILGIWTSFKSISTFNILWYLKSKNVLAKNLMFPYQIPHFLKSRLWQPFMPWYMPSWYYPILQFQCQCRQITITKKTFNWQNILTTWTFSEQQCRGKIVQSLQTKEMI